MAGNFSPLGIYFKEIGNKPILDQGQVNELAKVIGQKRALEKSLEEKKEKDSSFTLNGAQEKELLRVVQAGEAAKNELVESNLKLITYFAKQYLYRSGILSLDDLIQEGSRGLIRAAEKFDSSLGANFATYANYWIRQSIRRAITNNARTIRVPAHQASKVYNYEKAAEHLLKKLYRPPLVQEIADYMGLSVDEVNDMRQISIGIVSLKDSISEGCEKSLLNRMRQEQEANPFETDVAYTKNIIKDAMKTRLKDREKEVIRMRFGMDGNSEHTLEAIGIKLKVGKERARQILKSALEKLKQEKKLADLL